MVMKLLNVFTLFIFINVVTQSGATFPYKIKQLDDFGVVEEKISYMNVYNDEWNLIVFVNISDFDQQLLKLKQHEKQITQVCNLMSPYSVSCGTIRYKLASIIKEIELYRRLLPESNTNKRVKRGWFNIVGEMQKSAFGTLANSDAEFYDNQIRRLATNQINEHDLLRKQTAIIRSNIDLQTDFRMRVENQSRQFAATFDSFASSLGNLTTQIKKEFLDVNQIQRLDEIMFFTIFMAEEFKSKIQTIVVALSSNKNNIPLLLHPDVFFNELSRIQERMNDDQMLPVELSKTNIIYYYDIAIPEVGILDENIFIKLKIPILGKENSKFELYKIMSAPVKILDNVYGIIIPESPYIAINNKTFVVMDEKKSRHCHEVKQIGWLCPHMTTISIKINNSCELNLILKKKIC